MWLQAKRGRPCKKVGTHQNRSRQPVRAYVWEPQPSLHLPAQPRPQSISFVLLPHTATPHALGGGGVLIDCSQHKLPMNKQCMQDLLPVGWLVLTRARRRQEKVNSWQASLLGGPTAVGAATTIYRAQLPCKLRHYSHKAVCNSYCASKDPYILQRCSLPILYARWIKPA